VVVKACRKHIPLTELVLVAALCCSLAFAQEETAALTGQITDRDGLAVAGVKLQALNAGTNVSYLADTNETGFYNFPALPSGTYDVTATKDGFERAVRPGVELHVSDVISLNFSLQVGSLSESVTVEGGAPLVETTSSELGGLVNSKQITDLPLNGRNYIDLSLLQAGVQCVLCGPVCRGIIMEMGHLSRISRNGRRNFSAVKTAWRSAQSSANSSPAEFPANRENNREFARFYS
jgi:hypothetical protein